MIGEIGKFCILAENCPKTEVISLSLTSLTMFTQSQNPSNFDLYGYQLGRLDVN